jgi:hypothetical protein
LKFMTVLNKGKLGGEARAFVERALAEHRRWTRGHQRGL